MYFMLIYLLTAPIIDLPSASDILASTTEWTIPLRQAFWPIIIVSLSLAIGLGLWRWLSGWIHGK